MYFAYLLTYFLIHCFLIGLVIGLDFGFDSYFGFDSCGLGSIGFGFDIGCAGFIISSQEAPIPLYGSL